MQTLKSTILMQLALLLMTSISPLGLNAATQRVANFPPDRRDAIALRCDQLADSYDDAQRVGPGVPIDQINVSEALPVCQRAAVRQPARPRYQYLYGRVLDAAKRYGEAVQQYAAADQGGYPFASASLASLYADGIGVVKDPAKAAILYQRAGDKGLPDAYAELGLLYVEASPPNYTQALSELERAARAGSTLALTYLGEFYTNGFGVVKNQVRAIALFQQAANRGEPEGMMDLGLSYYSGAGVQRDPITAFRWLSRAAEFGFPQAQYAVGLMYEEGDGVVLSYEQAIAWYRKSAVQDDPFAMTHLAKLLIAAGNDAEAMAWYQRAAALGDPTGMTKLGDLLARAGNDAEAVDWYRKAAAKGFVDAENRLADDYRVGRNGIPQDYSQAALWYSKAVENGDTFAMVRLGELYENGLGVTQSTEQARQLYTRAAGDPEIPGMQARYNLAHLNGAPAPNDNGDLVSGGIITPPSGYEPAPPPRNDAPRDPVVGQRDDTPEPPHRPLPTRPAARSSDDDLKAAIILGAIVIGGVWLLSGSSGGSSSAGLNSSPPSSGGGGFGGGSPSTSPARPVTAFPGPPPPRPMTGNIFKVLDGEAGMSSTGVVRR